MSDITVEQIQSKIEGMGCDDLIVFGGNYVGGIHLQQIADEIAPCIFDLIKLGGIKNFLEIGAAAGGNAYLFNHFFGLDRIVLIDDNRHGKHGLRGKILEGIQYDMFIGNSHSDEAERFLEDLDLEFDILFVDGDHTHAGVKEDTERFTKFVRVGGFIIYHDTVKCHGVRAYVNEISDHPNLQLIDRYESRNYKPKLGITTYQIVGRK